MSLENIQEVVRCAADEYTWDVSVNIVKDTIEAARVIPTYKLLKPIYLIVQSNSGCSLHAPAEFRNARGKINMVDWGK